MTVTPQVRKLETSANYGKFDIEPLDPGFGTTLGNTLRRVLLSSLWGAAVTSIQIDGVAHEFTAIPHVKEDVTEVILNLKKLRLKSFTEDPITLLLDVKGPVEVRASHIQATSDVEIVNPDLYICTLAAKGHLRMELNVERGKGYVPAERNKREGQPIGVIPIDSIFSPVEKANFVVEKTRVGQSTDYDRLIIEVWTDGTMSPEEAVSHSAELFTQHLNLFVKFRDNIERHEQDLRGEKTGQNRLMDTPIEELDLSVRAFNCLKANEIQTVGQLLQKREEELLALRNFGRKSLDEIKEKLVEKGFIKPEEMGTVLRG
ncbi:MAG: DNA-directed RNA polymerase subunit alpha [Chloroflexi bacterium 13_1_40CM_4_65_16]|nr:MAG: DNA-directed RNA polymerase subunit alpha [Chloroflexi bacterium 13_1_40CM_66_19]OLC47491.1 MAG: DNA-directed RNA polymerase subunit alpha [Chloroflexi bacterium 13_1_40CM_4_65_16]OLE72395.1 MAG: DNA-directed RNA polymerase subunit alpha [Actinobacteria bacterium 13_1_20CM_2_66_18]TMF70347.1 MAG: DNA-directed RNA polymerase subunit alpha [Chloroflexota bacterium]TMF83842.1 MAG: DNA-directed RNA polymerase subunit alpha [Chloroflexota bacterium]